MGKSKYILKILKIGDKKMNSDFRKLKVSMIFVILFLSILTTLAIVNKDIETVSAASGDFFATNTEVSSKGNGTLNPEKQAEFSITVEYELMAPGNIGENSLYFPPTKAKLEVIGGDSDWLSASIGRPTFTITPDDPEEIKLTVDISPEAPYLEQHIITLKATALKNGVWQTSEGEVQVVIFPEFLYWLDADKETSIAEISPGDTHEFNIILKNDASYSVRYSFDTRNVPEHWIVSQPDSTNVNGNSQESVKVQVISPYGFGYHEEDVEFDVVVEAEPFPTTAGYEPKFVDSLSFTVKNRGFSTSLSGGGFLVFGGIIIAIIVLIMIFFFFSSRIREKKIFEKKKESKQK